MYIYIYIYSYIYVYIYYIFRKVSKNVAIHFIISRIVFRWLIHKVKYYIYVNKKAAI